ncbi:MAG: hypothetical protein K0Q49_106 [Haloplasmataceae bacterium]|jgi:NAD(P)H-nitrite reductase large subunit|nr:hypothetical protein [Haloplasmataceae bacterium]
MDCCRSNTNTSVSNICPICNFQGERVNTKTIEGLLIIDRNLQKDKTYYLCLNSDCDVAYFNDSNDIVLKSEVKVPIWYKKDANPKTICYCSKVTEEEIIDAIKTKNCKTVKEVVANTNAMKISNCVVNSPTGKCCSRQINDLLKIMNNK